MVVDLFLEEPISFSQTRTGAIVCSFLSTFTATMVLDWGPAIRQAGQGSLLGSCICLRRCGRRVLVRSPRALHTVRRLRSLARKEEPSKGMPAPSIDGGSPRSRFITVGDMPAERLDRRQPPSTSYPCPAWFSRRRCLFFLPSRSCRRRSTRPSAAGRRPRE
jgi:hypothetical protein